MSTFSTLPPSLRTTVRNWSSDGSDGALLEVGVEDDHQLVVTHAGNPPPLDSAATVSPWQEGYCVRAALGVVVTTDPGSQQCVRPVRLPGGGVPREIRPQDRRPPVVPSDAMTTLRIGCPRGTGRRDGRPDRRGAARAGRPRPDLPRRPAGLEGPGRRRTPGAPTPCARPPPTPGSTLYVHAPYRLNVATANNRIRIPSRKLLAKHADAAAGDRRAGLDRARRSRAARTTTRESGFDNWGKTFERWDAAAAGPDREHRRRRRRDGPPARPAGPALGGLRGPARAAVLGRRLLPRHLPRARRRRGAGRRRRPGQGHHRPDRPGARQRLARRVRLRRRPARQLRQRPHRPATTWSPSSSAAGAPVVCETPGGAEGQAADIAWLRERLPG